MSTVKNQKKTKKSEKIRISKNNRIYFFYVEFSRNFKLVVDFFKKTTENKSRCIRIRPLMLTILYLGG